MKGLLFCFFLRLSPVLVFIGWATVRSVRLPYVPRAAPISDIVRFLTLGGISAMVTSRVLLRPSLPVSWDSDRTR